LKPADFGAAVIDIRSKMHMVAVNRADVPVRSFGKFTRDPHDLAGWFKARGVTSVAMQPAGVYWIRVYAILEKRGL
jgi:transposase